MILVVPVVWYRVPGITYRVPRWYYGSATVVTGSHVGVQSHVYRELMMLSLYGSKDWFTRSHLAHTHRLSLILVDACVDVLQRRAGRVLFCSALLIDLEGYTISYSWKQLFGFPEELKDF